MLCDPDMTRICRKSALAALLSTLVGPLLADQAQASCVEPPLELLWSYPSDGAQEVPLNAQFWALTSLSGAEVEATLNGVALQATRELNALRFEPGSLTPDTDYTLHLSGPFHATSAGLDLHFRTGSSTASAPAAPLVLGHATSSELGGTGCPDVIAAQDCFDTGQDTLLRFSPAASDAIAWLVRAEEGGYGAGLSPVSACSAPALFIDDDRPLGCFELRSVGPGGIASSPSRFCPETGGASDDGADADAEDTGSERTQDADDPEMGAGFARDEGPPPPGEDKVIRSDGCSATTGAAAPRLPPLGVTLMFLAFVLQRRRSA